MTWSLTHEDYEIDPRRRDPCCCDLRPADCAMVMPPKLTVINNGTVHHGRMADFVTDGEPTLWPWQWVPVINLSHDVQDRTRDDRATKHREHFNTQDEFYATIGGEQCANNQIESRARVVIALDNLLSSPHLAIPLIQSKLQIVIYLNYRLMNICCFCHIALKKKLKMTHNATWIKKVQ